MFKPTVFVVAADGSFVQHGPVRRSEKQARMVAAQLGRRLGWQCRVAEVDAVLEPCPADPSRPSLAQAGCSPVWRDPVLEAIWNGGPRRAAAPVAAAPVAPVADKFDTDRRLAALGLVIG